MEISYTGQVPSPYLLWAALEIKLFKNLQSQQFMRHPVAQLEAMRNQGPLVRVKVPIIGKVWLTTNQSATAEILKNDDLFKVRKDNGSVAGLSWWMPRSLSRLTQNMLSCDDPEHKRLRNRVDEAFSRSAVMDLDPAVSTIARNLSRSLFVADESVDLISSFARPFPLSVICELLGLPAKDRRKFSEWAQGITTVKGMISFLMAIRQLRPLTKYLEQRIKREREFGGVGLIATFLEENAETSDPLSDDELVAMVFLLLLAGHETTTHLLSGSILTLLQHRDQLEWLRSDWDRLDLAIEECLRFVSPVQTTKPRYVHRDVEVEGVTLHKGDLVMPFLVAANFDPLVFEDPGRFDISRKPNRHMEFGTGVHFCLGHQLARMEMKRGLQVLLTDWPTLQLAVDESDIVWNERFGLRSLSKLPVRN